MPVDPKIERLIFHAFKDKFVGCTYHACEFEVSGGLDSHWYRIVYIDREVLGERQIMQTFARYWRSTGEISFHSEMMSRGNGFYDLIGNG